MWLELTEEDHAQSEVQKASQRALGRVCKDIALIWMKTVEKKQRKSWEDDWSDLTPASETLDCLHELTLESC